MIDDKFSATDGYDDNDNHNLGGGMLGGSGREGLQAHTRGGLQAHSQGAPGPLPGRVSRPTPGGCIPACTEADPPPPPSRRQLLRG